eukprot:TRINITY_DN36159_c0_g1_i1.p1 TRINITY_DN36159_c0_g1~~TRINITY_DN36159_c0_g1_i1.p1  ORF type:complete len:367 (-),score=31.51 TRINITY_DN36159_c0_g1_i1:252-1352(-)
MPMQMLVLTGTGLGLGLNSSFRTGSQLSAFQGCRTLGVTIPYTDVPRSVHNYDDILLAVHADVAAKLLPFDTQLDAETGCALLSHWKFKLLANAIYRDHNLLDSSSKIDNEEHRADYSTCIVHVHKVAERLQLSTPKSLHRCFFDPPVAAVYIKLPGGLASTVYFRWGSAKRKSEGQSVVNYTAATLESARPCDDEPAVASLADRWGELCYGCTVLEAGTILQQTVSMEPYLGVCWSTLAVWMFRFLDKDMWTLAATCYIIADQLSKLNGEPLAPQVRSSMEFFDDQFTQAGVTLDVDALWAHRGRGLAEYINDVLTAEQESDGGRIQFWRLGGHSLDKFTAHLTSSPPHCAGVRMLSIKCTSAGA